MGTFSDRLRLLIGDQTQTDFANKVGLNQSVINAYLQGRTPRVDKLQQIATATGVDFEWLAFGVSKEDRENARKSQINIVAESIAGGLADGIKSVLLGPGRSIPVVGLVHAGELFEACDGNFPPGIASEYVVTDTPGRCLFAVRCEGDSMEPDFRARDILVINPELNPQVGDFVIIKMGGEVVFKRLVRQEPDLVQLKSLNSKYPDLVLTPGQPFRIIGKMVEMKRLF